jgi:hypothetical protein
MQPRTNYCGSCEALSITDSTSLTCHFYPPNWDNKYRITRLDGWCMQHVRVSDDEILRRKSIFVKEEKKIDPLDMSDLLKNVK